ncbi:MAG: bifunctional mannitol-1-phosphate dehydrogenase/phosphatase [Candidatus Bathyarchaeia archaeon]|jgi:HAD superfamily hydrolase (TIGR01509 family)
MIFQNKTVEGAIFDMDGTMFDTERLRFKMIKQASKEIFGTEISDKILYDSLGVSAVTAENFAKTCYGEKYPYKKIRERADELERNYVREHGVPVKEGLYNLLERLKKNGVLLALATSSRREIAEEYLLNARVLRFFDVVVCGDEVEKGKPNPEIFLKAASELNCELGNCFIFEDSHNGLLAASAAGGMPIFFKDIKEIVPEVKALAFRAYDKMTDFLDELITEMPKMPMPSLNEHFPQSRGYIIAGIHGFGAIGGGYLAQIFCHWDGYTRPRQIIGVTNDNLIRQLVNALGKYRVKYESLAYFQQISNPTIVDMDDEPNVIEMYKKAHIIGLALPEQAIKSQAKLIAKGLIERYNNSGEGVTLLVVMNKINSARYVRTHVENAAKQLVGEEQAKKIVKASYFTETVVNRMVARLPDETILSNVQNELYKMHKSILDYSGKMKEIIEMSQNYFAEINSAPKRKRSAEIENKTVVETIHIADNISHVTQFADELSKLNVTLFSSEPDMPLYASKGSPLLERLRQIVTVDDIKTMQEIKNKLSNGPHAIIAWYSALLGYKTIGQGMGDPRVSKLAEKVIKNEIKPALLLENPNSKQYINSFTQSFLKRCRASFKDSCSRVGRDPMRKLQAGERVIGAIKLSQKHNLTTKGLEFGAACAIMYSLLLTNENDDETQKIKEIYQKRHSIEDVLTYNGEYNKSKYAGLNPNDDHELITRIKENFETLKKELNQNDI